MPVSQITRRHVLDFKDKLLSSGQTATNTDKQLSLLGTLLQYAADNLLADTNAVKGVKVGKRKNAKAARVPFDLPALHAIFSSPVYTEGFRPEGGAGEAAYWLPLCALFTGARVEELCQLAPHDIYEQSYHADDGTDGKCWVMRVTNAGEDQGVKNAGSNRRFPIHAELISRGFIEYAQAQKGNRIFPQLKPDVRGAESGNWSKWFGKYLRNACKATDKRMVFHSARHNFKDTARHCSIPEDVADAITGHSSSSVARNYGGLDYPLLPMIDAVRKYRVPGLKLPS
jgi:integrase